MIIEKLGIFEAGVINELKEATSHFSFKAYEESFRKIETDMDTFYKELLKMREDFEFKNKDLGEELADVVFVVLCLANQTGINLQEAFDKKLDLKTERDKNRHKNNEKLK